MAERLDTLEFPFELGEDYSRARSLEGMLRAIEETLRDADDSAQCRELIGAYLGAYNERIGLTGDAIVTGSSLSDYEPSQHMVDLVTATYGES